MAAIGLAPVSESDLARSAIAGDGAAFAELYDRHERRAFNLAYRITGSREDAADATQEAFLKMLARLPRLGDRELDFGSYLLTAVRHASYDVMARGRRAEPTEELPESARPVGAAAAPPPEDEPDRAVLLAASQEEIRAANASLAPRQREALALCELEGLSYDEIAVLMAMNRNSVAQLISRARIALRDALRHTALRTIPPASKACERALPLIAMRDDGQLKVSDDAGWLDAHLATCKRCVLGAEAMAEAGASYRIWAPVAAFEVLRRETIAEAGARLGHDWSEVAAGSRAPAVRGRRLRGRFGQATARAMRSAGGARSGTPLARAPRCRRRDLSRDGLRIAFAQAARQPRVARAGSAAAARRAGREHRRLRSSPARRRSARRGRRHDAGDVICAGQGRSAAQAGREASQHAPAGRSGRRRQPDLEHAPRQRTGRHGAWHEPPRTSAFHLRPRVGEPHVATTTATPVGSEGDEGSRHVAAAPASTTAAAARGDTAAATSAATPTTSAPAAASAAAARRGKRELRRTPASAATTAPAALPPAGRVRRVRSAGALTRTGSGSKRPV